MTDVLSDLIGVQIVCNDKNGFWQGRVDYVKSWILLQSSFICYIYVFVFSLWILWESIVTVTKVNISHFD